MERQLLEQQMNALQTEEMKDIDDFQEDLASNDTLAQSNINSVSNE